MLSKQKASALWLPTWGAHLVEAPTEASSQAAPLDLTSVLISSGKRKEPKPKLFGPDIFQWGRGLPREGVGAKKLGMSLETRGTKIYWAGYPRILPGYIGGARRV